MITALPQWVVVLLVPKPDGRTDKIPCSPTSGLPADAHDPANWTTHAAATATTAAWGAGWTTGFVLTAADPYWCLDIDGALQADGTWSPLSQALVAALPDTMVEVSQSGRGLHIWGAASVMPPHSMKNVALHIELYSSRRFIASGTNQTGVIVPDSPGLAAVIATYFPPRAPAVAALASGPCPEWRGPTDDAELLRRALRSRSPANAFDGKASFSDLWDANATVLSRAYPPDASSNEPFDRSSTDMALALHLAFWTGRDVARCEALMRQSALRRDKWDDRADYLERTITRACEGCRDVLRDRPVVSPGIAGAGAGAGAGAVGRPAAARTYLVSADMPFETAQAFCQRKHSHLEGPTLRAWRQNWVKWDRARSQWVGRDDADIRAEMYPFLESEGYGQIQPNQAKVNQVIDALRAVAHTPSNQDAPGWLPGGPANRPPAAEVVACRNGLLHLPTLTLLAPTPQFFSLNATPFDYVPHPLRPVAWHAFLAQLWPNDPESVSVLQEVFGYLLVPDTSLQKIFLLIGPKRSGKGTLARVLTALCGPDNVASPSLSGMASQFGLAPLLGKLVAIIADARLSGRTDSAAVAEHLLRISGEDAVEVARKFKDPVTTRLPVRFVVLTNELPRLADASGAMASRFLTLRIVPSFYGREDPGLAQRLMGELPGILNWAIEGWQRLHCRGHFIEPRASAEAAQQLADLGSPISAFVRDRCTVGPAAEVEVDRIYSEWRVWCAAQGIDRPGAKHQFGRDLSAAFPEIALTQPRIEGRRLRAYRGIGLEPGTGGTGGTGNLPKLRNLMDSL